MNKIYILPFLIISIVALTVSTGITAPNKDFEDILSSAESLFKVMKEKNYSKIWFYLSNASRKSITDDTYKNIMKYEKERGREMRYSREQIGVDFSNGGPIAQAYWNSYLDVSILILSLNKADGKWEM